MGILNQQVLSGNWNEVRGKLKQKWGKLTNDDLRVFSGNVEQLVGQIQRKTGESRETIEDFLGRISEEVESGAGELGRKVQAGAAQAADTMREAKVAGIANVIWLQNTWVSSLSV